MTFLDEIVSELKSTVNLVELAESLGIHRKRNNWLCPFHNDHDPSLQIKERWFRCYACGAKGDAIKFVTLLRGMSFRDALEFLAGHAGIVLPSKHGRRRVGQGQAAAVSPRQFERQTSTPEPAVSPERRVELLTSFAKIVRIKESRKDDHPGLAYLRRRGINRDAAHRAGIGYVGHEYETAARILREELAPLSDLQAVGLFNAKGNFRLFKHRLVIPYEFDGSVHLLQVRNINWRDKERDGPKELTIGSITIPFNSNVFLEEPDQVYVCEGAIDTLSLLELGLPAVGIPGARNFKPWWVELFADVKDIVLAFDNDSAGCQATAEVTNHFAKAGRRVRVLELPEGIKDVNELLLAEQRGVQR
jgi:DNA primase